MVKLTQEQFNTIKKILEDADYDGSSCHLISAFEYFCAIEHCCGSCAEGHTRESETTTSKEEQDLEQQRKIDYGKTC